MRHKLIQIYKGDQFISSGIKPSKKKVIVFDLDETIGSFTDLEILWNSLGEFDFFKQDQDSFNALLDLYPEFLRYGILNILDFLHYKKKKGHCYKLFIYTNNKFPRVWTSMIIRYLEQKQDLPGLFDQLICAFRVNDVILEPSRTSSSKTHSDLIRCSLLPKTSEICFIDDKYFEGMDVGRVYYIQPKPYFHAMLTCDIISRVCKSKLISGLNDDVLRKCLLDAFIVVNKTAKSSDEITTDKMVSQKIMFHIQEFFHLTTCHNRTQKLRKYSIGKFTRKRTRPTSTVRVRTP